MPVKKLEDDPETTAKTRELTALAFQLPTAQQAAEAAFGACATAAAFAGWTLEQFLEWVKGSAEVSFRNSVLPSPMPSYGKAQKFMAQFLVREPSEPDTPCAVVPCTVPDPVTLTCPHCQGPRVSLRHASPPDSDGSVQCKGTCPGCGRGVDVKFSPIPKAKA